MLASMFPIPGSQHKVEHFSGRSRPGGGPQQEKGLQGSIQKAVAGRAIQERFESDSKAIRSDSDNLNEHGVGFRVGFG